MNSSHQLIPLHLPQIHMSKDLSQSSEESTRISDLPGSCLIVSTEIDGSLYEWFEVTDSLIERITLDIFLCQLRKFFINVTTIHDIDGPIETTMDLRRSLRSLAPFIIVRSLTEHHVDQDRIRYPPPVPIVRQ